MSNSTLSANADALPPARRAWPDFLIAALFGLLFVVQCLWFIDTQSLTWDEPEHTVAGLEAWRYGEIKRWDDQPPLARMVISFPLLFAPWQYEMINKEVEPIRPAPEIWAWRTRPMNVLLGLVLAALIWTTARRRFSPGAANFALALFSFSPCVIANFSLATVDGAGVLCIFVTALQTARWMRSPTRRQTLLLGFTLGGALLVKFYTLATVALALLFVLLRKPPASAQNRWWNIRNAVLVAALASLVVWAAYFFHVSTMTFEPGRITAMFPEHSEPVVYSAPVNFHARIRVPALEFITGLGNQVHHNTIRGHRSYFLGEVSKRGGWLLYFPVVILVKWPTIVLLAFVVGAVLFAARRIAWPEGFWVLFSFGILFFLTALFTHVNIGDRHILPLYPFVLLVCAGLWEYARGLKVVRWVLMLALLLNAADALRYAPDALSYFNVFVRPERSYQLLSDSNLDWGQGLIALREYQKQHPSEVIHLAYFGHIQPERYGIRAAPLAEGERATGTVIVSATNLTGQYLNDPTSFRWVLRYPRKAILNHTLHVFEVPAVTSPQEPPSKDSVH